MSERPYTSAEGLAAARVRGFRSIAEWNDANLKAQTHHKETMRRAKTKQDKARAAELLRITQSERETAILPYLNR